MGVCFNSNSMDLLNCIYTQKSQEIADPKNKIDPPTIYQDHMFSNLVISDLDVTHDREVM